MSAPALLFEGVRFGYGRTPVLPGLDLVVETGTITGILGPNGTGKTTLVRLASAVLAPSAGAIRLFGDDLATLPPRERARRVAVVPQETSPVFEFSVEEIVRMGRAPHLGWLGLGGRHDREAVREAMRRVAIEPLAARSYRALSGGERQRVLLARALAQEARLVLLDEPTAYLDLKHRLAVYATLLELHRAIGLTAVVVSHDINLAARYCDRLVLLRNGTIAADGPPEAVLRPEPIRAVYEVDVDIGRDPGSGRPFVIPRDPRSGPSTA